MVELKDCKVGLKVRGKENGLTDEIVSFPRMHEYDRHNFACKEDGFYLKYNRWQWRHVYVIDESRNDDDYSLTY